MTLLTLDTKCGRCGSRPKQRIFPKTRERYLDDDDDDLISTWQCQGCGEVHVLTAKAYKGAK